jgi:hypothetical protein
VLVVVCQAADVGSKAVAALRRLDSFLAGMAKLADAADLKSDNTKLRSEINTTKTSSY